MASISEWHAWPAFKQAKVRNQIIALARKMGVDKATHEMVEEAVLEVEPSLKQFDVMDDEYVELISAIWLEYDMFDGAE